MLEDILTTVEETLVERGEEELVRTVRLTFQEAEAERFKAVVAEAMGRKVVTYHSQVAFDPPMGFEIFVLEPEAEARNGPPSPPASPQIRQTSSGDPFSTATRPGRRRNSPRSRSATSAPSVERGSGTSGVRDSSGANTTKWAPGVKRGGRSPGAGS